MDAAVKANSFAICQELCKFLDIQTDSLTFKDLAGVDGSLEVMIEKLEINPGELHARRSVSGNHTIGQFALTRAARLLRVENVRFLLEWGVRFHDRGYAEPPIIEWRRKRANEQKYHEVQRLLLKYGQPELQLEL